jgi:hypothetical protein
MGAHFDVPEGNVQTIWAINVMDRVHGGGCVLRAPEERPFGSRGLSHASGNDRTNRATGS